MSKSKKDVESCKLANCNCIKHFFLQWARADPAKVEGEREQLAGEASSEGNKDLLHVRRRVTRAG